MTKVRVAYPPSFYMHLDDPSSHLDIIEGLESRYKVEDWVFRTIYGTFQGYKIYASRKVAEKIEKQIRYEAKLCNVDVRGTWQSMTSSLVENKTSPASART